MSFPNEITYLALADITACFCFPSISADVAGAFGFIAELKYFASTSHVFGSNTLASSWEAFRRVIQNLITVLAQQDDLTKKHEDLLNILRWTDENACPEFVQAFPCNINHGVLDESGNIVPMMENIYVDGILAAAAFQGNMSQLLAAIIKATFLVCGTPDIAVRQCPLSLEKWHELIFGPRQIVLGLVIDTNKMIVGITDDYIKSTQSASPLGPKLKVLQCE